MWWEREQGRDQSQLPDQEGDDQPLRQTLQSAARKGEDHDRDHQEERELRQHTETEQRRISR